MKHVQGLSVAKHQMQFELFIVDVFIGATSPRVIRYILLTVLWTKRDDCFNSMASSIHVDFCILKEIIYFYFM